MRESPPFTPETPTWQNDQTKRELLLLFWRFDILCQYSSIDVKPGGMIPNVTAMQQSNPYMPFLFEQIPHDIAQSFFFCSKCLVPASGEGYVGFAVLWACSLPSAMPSFVSFDLTLAR